MKKTFHPLERLRATASRRRPGYMEEILRRGELSADGKTVALTRHDFDFIRQKFNPRTGSVLLQPACC